ncbi:MAG: hypothetical protein V2A58_04005 [Planctomycetota bacterium]
MRRRRGSGLIAAIAAMVWIGFLVSAATVYVIESIGRVEWELAKLRSDAAMVSGLAVAREVAGKGEGTAGEIVVELIDARASVALARDREGKGVLVTIRASGRGRNDVESQRMLVVDVPMWAGDRKGARN